jgi:hypothetical protein
VITVKHFPSAKRCEDSTTGYPTVRGITDLDKSDFGAILAVQNLIHGFKKQWEERNCMHGCEHFQVCLCVYVYTYIYIH